MLSFIRIQDDQHRADVLAKLKRLNRKSCRIIQTATRVCYQPRVCPLALAPAAKSLVSSLTDIALVLTSSGTEQKNEYDLALMELEVFLIALAIAIVSVCFVFRLSMQCFWLEVMLVYRIQPPVILSAMEQLCSKWRWDQSDRSDWLDIIYLQNIVDFTSDPKKKSLVQAVRNILDFAIQVHVTKIIIVYTIDRCVFRLQVYVHKVVKEGMIRMLLIITWLCLKWWCGVLSS